MKNIEDINKAAIQKITAKKKITEFESIYKQEEEAVVKRSEEIEASIYAAPSQAEREKIFNENREDLSILSDFQSIEKYVFEEQKVDVTSDFYENIGGDPQKPKLDTKRMSEIGRDNYKSSGFWYWAKKYSQEFGPVILIQMLNDSGWENVQNNVGYLARLRAAFVQYIGEGYPADEYEKCFLSLMVVMTPQGGNLIDVAMRLNEFIKNMNGEGEICCGGKGISF